MSLSLFDLALVLVAAVLAQTASAQPRESLRARHYPPVDLRCESFENPIGLDESRPRFSWLGSDPARGASQTAYRILVASHSSLLAEDKGDLWDSGRVDSGRSAHVEYDGEPLRSSTKGFYKVRTWNGRREPSGWSDVATFETALFDPSEWRASWIGPREGFQSGRAVAWGDWITSPGPPAAGETLYFRFSFDLDDAGSVEEAALKIVAADEFVAFVGGTRVASGEGLDVERVDLAPSLATGRNVIAVRTRIGSGGGAIMLGARIDFRHGRRAEIGTTEEWKTSAVGVEDWFRPDFDDGSWDRAASLGPHGVPPWGQVEDDRGPRRSVLLRKEFTLDRPVREARLRISGLGCYEVSINGERVSNDVLSPGWTHYPKRVQYATHDVTALLRPGGNAIGAILGNGWWSGGLGWLERFRYSDGGLRLIAELDVRHDDGSTVSFTTDRSWKTHLSPIVFDSLYDGEWHDARLELAGWDEPSFDDEAWESGVEIRSSLVGRLVARRAEPVRPTAEVPVGSAAVLASGETILDFGQNMAGRVRMTVSGERGTLVTLRFAELLGPDGRLDTENLRSALATDRYVLKGEGVETWEPRFTYHGFRYVEVSGLPAASVDPANFTAVVLHTDARRTGTFRCSDPLLNRIQQLILWSHRSNLFDMITDCPQRDERMGWTGDAMISSPTYVLNMGVAPVLSKWLRDVIDSQRRDGSVTDIAPVVTLWSSGASGWGDIVVTLPWTLYVQTGDARVIEACYAAMKRWVEFMRANAPGDLYRREGYGDWVAVVPSPKAPIAGAYYYHSTRLLARMAHEIGRDADALEYAALAARIRTAFNAAYFDPAAATYAGGTQTANVLPLHFGLVPSEDEARVLDTLVADVEARGGHLSTGFLGTAFLPSVLARGGRNDVFHGIATKRAFPSWGYMIDRGATTLWEQWNADLDPEHPSMNSRNHPSLSSVGRWFYEELAGLKPDSAAPGYKRTLVRPYLPPGMTFASAELDTVHGRVASRWDRDDERIALDVTLPPNTSGEIAVPLATDPAIAIVEESGVTLLANGGAAENQWIHFLRFEPGYAVFAVSAGTYSFVSR